MDTRHDMQKVTACSEPISVWDSKRIHVHRGNPMHNILCDVINQMGEGSRKAQGLSQILTSVQRLQSAPDHRLYLLSQHRSALGILKVGVKKLFVRSESGQIHEIEPLCVLDFYVHEAAQRSGFGKSLFEYMLVNENILPHQIGYDRPSPKLLGFLSKHYKLNAYVPQSNNFVVFNAFFDPRYKGMFSGCDVPPVPRPAAAPVPVPAATNNSMLMKSSSVIHQTQPTQQLPQLKSTMLREANGNSSSPIGLMRRETSPTRSGCSYNIITLQEEGGVVGPNSLVGGHTSVGGGANNSMLNRSRGRRSSVPV
eukprot:PhF_6_TR4526/c0_g1_i2/m.6340/K19573/ATAT1, MEC17; alpha-tubulin N-acetyltransferase 1